MSIKVANPNEPRAFTNALIENAEQMVFSWEEIARAALGWMSEDDVQRMCESEFDMEAEEDEDEEDTDPDPDDSDNGPAAYDENGDRLEAGDKVEWNGGNGRLTPFSPKSTSVLSGISEKSAKSTRRGAKSVDISNARGIT